mmetsp:Transcript_93309/g.273144  ORF Transcript_93309/g.273144 Transcript_93309/m.273144 type:complete len:352 (+) Transcript_93309:84-1139(+)
MPGLEEGVWPMQPIPGALVLRPQRHPARDREADPTPARALALQPLHEKPRAPLLEHLQHGSGLEAAHLRRLQACVLPRQAGHLNYPAVAIGLGALHGLDRRTAHLLAETAVFGEHGGTREASGGRDAAARQHVHGLSGACGIWQLALEAPHKHHWTPGKAQARLLLQRVSRHAAQHPLSSRNPTQGRRCVVQNQQPCAWQGPSARELAGHLNGEDRAGVCAVQEQRRRTEHLQQGCSDRPGRCEARAELRRAERHDDLSAEACDVGVGNLLEGRPRGASVAPEEQDGRGPAGDGRLPTEDRAWHTAKLSMLAPSRYFDPWLAPDVAQQVRVVVDVFNLDGPDLLQLRHCQR